jgi:hypothetical protein
MTYLERRAAGLCARCPRRATRATCDRCASRQLLAQRLERDERRAAGVCTMCSAIPQPGRIRCPLCALDQRKAQAESRARRAS